MTVGSNKLTRLDSFLGDFEALLAGPERIGKVPPLWDGQTAGRVIEALVAAAPSGETRTT
ncbi:MAG: hypothetical protein M0C28_27550 [Candidatus Moduliflexus flocculans]|nr:hypothetical protein [Candidatus Moduliflexus flocculans]